MFPGSAFGISEFFPDELAAIMNTSLTAATVLTDVAATLVMRLPTAWEALVSGALDWPRARALAVELARPVRESDPVTVAAVEAAVVPVAMEMSVRALKAAVRRELLSRDAAEADRRRKEAARHADVVLRPAPDGMCELSIFCPQPMGAALRETADTYARMAKETGDPRPLGQLRV